jgi:hypothetical protein
MSLIRCLGKITLPLAYRRYMRDEVEHYKRLRKKSGTERWTQEFLTIPSDPGHEYHNDQVRFIGKDMVKVIKPHRCPKLEATLAQFGKGQQQHCCMTLVEAAVHYDDAMDVKDIALLIPYQVSPLHFLTVEDDERQLLPGHIYAFNQRREHSLLYRSENGVFSASKPCSILNICFERKHRANPNRY